MINNWEELKFWDSGEWQVLQERFDEWDEQRRLYNPSRNLLFTSMDVCPFDTVRVCIMGQDPYPDHRLCTGIAFSIPKDIKVLPPTLITILAELRTDMGYEELPTHGDLTKWCNQGVFLWNVTPTCDPGKPGSHSRWPEWSFLTSEIVKELNEKGVVFCFLGNKAREYAKPIRDKIFPESAGILDKSNEGLSSIIEVGHTSSMGRPSKVPFAGSRIFSRINALLVQGHGLEPINWRLSCLSGCHTQTLRATRC